MKKVTIGITTYNRKNILEKMIQSLLTSDLTNAEVHIRIYDDCSTEYDSDYLKSLFPFEVAIHVNEINLKADLNTFNMYKDFLNSNDDYFFNADSDLIFHKNWLNFALENIEKTDGVLTLYNSQLHKEKNIYENFVQKDDIGAAGTFFSREIIKVMIENLFPEAQKTIDWSFSKLFNNKNIKILCSKNSYVQHIGFSGQNCNLSTVEYGKNFQIDSLVNGQILNDVLTDFSAIIPSLYTKRINEIKKSISYRLGKIIVKPFKILKKILKI